MCNADVISELGSDWRIDLNFEYHEYARISLLTNQGRFVSGIV